MSVKTTSRLATWIAGFAGRAVRDPRGEASTVEQLTARQAGIVADLEAAARAGLPVHRVAAWQRRLARALPLLDGLVFLWFLLEVLNVDVRRFEFGWVLAGCLALLATVAVALWITAVGEYLNGFLDDHGHLVQRAVDGVGRFMVGVTALLLALVGWTMYMRVSEEIDLATGGTGWAGKIVAVTLAAAIVVTNLFGLAVAMHDGNQATRELDRIGRVLHRMRRRHEHDVVRLTRIRVRDAYRIEARMRVRGALPPSEDPRDHDAGAT